VIAALVDLFPEESVSVATMAGIVGVVLGATVMPVLRTFADPVQRRATRVIVVLKHIIGVIICGALIALGNWIYTLSSMQWNQAGLPDLPPMLAKAGAGPAPQAAGGVHGAGPIRGTGAPAATGAQPDFLNRYMD
jgi:hypothetical protein